ncbi:MAG: class I SAM-dependent methyltransferase [Thermosynechococcaceae cyanobacterium]
MALYNKIGRTYAQTRKSDPRIASKLLDLLKPSQATIVADIGAGTGSYAQILADQGYHVLAVEPSKIMRRQAISHPNIQWIDASAETLSLPDQSVDAAIVMLAFHHFQSYRQALQEIHRIAGQIILFTYDPDMITHFWLTEYFPSFASDVQTTFLPISTLTTEMKSITEKDVAIVPFPLPNDLSDAFAAVGWSRPELYLDLNIRNGISSFAKLTDDELQKGLLTLQADLETRVWDQKYGHLRQQNQYDAGYRFIHT